MKTLWLRESDGKVTRRRTAFPIRDEEDVQGLIDLAAVGLDKPSERNACLERTILKPKRNRQENRQGKDR